MIELDVAERIPLPGGEIELARPRDADKRAELSPRGEFRATKRPVTGYGTGGFGGGRY